MAFGMAALWITFAPLSTPPEPTPELEATKTVAESPQPEPQPLPSPANQTPPGAESPPLQAQPSKPAATEELSVSPSEPQLASKTELMAKRSAPSEISESSLPRTELEAKKSSTVSESTQRSVSLPPSPVTPRPALPRAKKPAGRRKTRGSQGAGKAPIREQKEAVKATPKLEAKVRPTPIRPRPAQPGLYETITAATARSAPSDAATVVDQIQPGTILHVSGSEGEWLVVQAKRRNITVYVKRDEAMYRANQRPWGLASRVPESRWKNIESEIHRTLAKEGLKGVRVSFIGDTAYLKGTVKTETDRDRAEMAAHSIPEVKHIFNAIRVDRTWYP